MARERLTSRVAEDMKSKPGTQVSDKGTGIDNDAYDMNNTGHEKNDPKVDAYAKGDPEAWAEGVNKDKVNKDDKRVTTGHSELIDKHAAEEAVATVKALEKKAVKCMVASQRMLPGAGDDILVKQAIDLMNLPEEAINATLARQEALANSLKMANDDSDEDDKPCKKDNDDERDAAAKKDLEDKMKKLRDMQKEAAELEKEIEAGQNDPKAAYGKGQKETEVNAKLAAKDGEEACDKEAKAEKKDDGEELEAAKKDEEELEAAKKDDGEELEAAKKDDGEELEAAKKCDDEGDDSEEASSKEASLLDTIFSDVIASDKNKKGVTKLSGMVKKEAAEGGDSLSKLWASAPDVSGIYQ